MQDNTYKSILEELKKQVSFKHKIKNGALYFECTKNTESKALLKRAVARKQAEFFNAVRARTLSTHGSAHKVKRLDDPYKDLAVACLQRANDDLKEYYRTMKVVPHLWTNKSLLFYAGMLGTDEQAYQSKVKSTFLQYAREWGANAIRKFEYREDCFYSGKSIDTILLQYKRLIDDHIFKHLLNNLYSEDFQDKPEIANQEFWKVIRKWLQGLLLETSYITEIKGKLDNSKKKLQTTVTIINPKTYELHSFKLNVTYKPPTTETIKNIRNHKLIFGVSG